MLFDTLSQSLLHDSRTNIRDVDRLLNGDQSRDGFLQFRKLQIHRRTEFIDWRNLQERNDQPSRSNDRRE